jgi:hypothetical protein
MQDEAGLDFGARLALAGIVAGLAGTVAAMALPLAYPDTPAWIWRAIFWPSLLLMVAAFVFLAADLIIHAKTHRVIEFIGGTIRRWRVAITAASGMIACVVIMVANKPVSQAPSAPPPAVSTPAESQPVAQLVSTISHMIYRCPLPADDSKLSAEDRKARNDRFRKDIAVIGRAVDATITLRDLPEAVRFEVAPNPTSTLQWGATQKLTIDASRLSNGVLVTVDVQIQPPLDLISRLIHLPIETEPAKTQTEKAQQIIRPLIERLFGISEGKCVMI